MASPDPAQSAVRFGDFAADLEAGQLRRNGAKVKIQGQPFEVLALLLKRPGRIVTREELRRRLWPSDTFVDFEHGLNAAVNRLREVLEDSADSPRFIETLPRRGYRFVASVENNSQSSAASVLHRFEDKTALISGGVILALLVSGIGIWRFSRKSVESPVLSGEAAPLTGLSGLQTYPAFSPDGNQVAFVILGGHNPGIYTTLVGGERPLQLTSNGGDSSPTWSPDGREIAFMRVSSTVPSPWFYINRSQVSIYVIPSLGGNERKLYTFAYRPPDQGRWVSWSPAGRLLAFNQDSRIQLFSIGDSTARPLTSPPDRSYDYAPAFSPDGASVVFARRELAGLAADLFVVPVEGGDARRLTFDNSPIISTSAWTTDGREIVFSSSRRGFQNLWRIPVSGGTPRAVTAVVTAFNPTISRKGELAYQQDLSNDSISRLQLRDETHQLDPTTPVISAKWHNARPDFSPDGKRIAFESDRSGYSEIWTCHSDGTNCAQLTSLRSAAGAARWSPDGRYIAFELHSREHSKIQVIEVPGGSSWLVQTLPGADSLAPTWSRDGQWIYFSSDHTSGRFDVWKVPLKGGSPVQVTRNGGSFAVESKDRRFLYYSKDEAPGIIWRMPLNAGGEETRILDERRFRSDEVPLGCSYDWTLDGNGIYFLYWTYVAGADPADPAVTTPVPNRANIGFFRFLDGKRNLISSPDKLMTCSGLALSPDGRSILFVQNEFTSSTIMVLKSFR